MSFQSYKVGARVRSCFNICFPDVPKIRVCADDEHRGKLFLMWAFPTMLCRICLTTQGEARRPAREIDVMGSHQESRLNCGGAAMLQGLERLRKNSSFDRMGRGIPQRLKADARNRAFLARVNSCPFKTRSCGVAPRPLSEAFMARLKLVPFQNIGLNDLEKSRCKTLIAQMLCKTYGTALIGKRAFCECDTSIKYLPDSRGQVF